MAVRKETAQYTGASGGGLLSRMPRILHAIEPIPQHLFQSIQRRFRQWFSPCAPGSRVLQTIRPQSARTSVPRSRMARARPLNGTPGPVTGRRIRQRWLFRGLPLSRRCMSGFPGRHGCVSKCQARPRTFGSTRTESSLSCVDGRGVGPGIRKGNRNAQRPVRGMIAFEHHGEVAPLRVAKAHFGHQRKPIESPVLHGLQQDACSFGRG